MIRLVVADDQSLIRGAFVALLGLESDLEVVGQASSVEEVLDVVRREQPDVVVMDVQMPGSAGVADGIDASAAIRRFAPHTRVIVVTTFGRPGYLRRALEAGVLGFMVKDAPAEHLIEGVRRVAQGLRVVDPELAVSSLSTGPSPLTTREAEVLASAGAGGTTADIARRVFLSEGTVRNYLSSAMGKVGAGTRAEAVRIATENGWLG